MDAAIVTPAGQPCVVGRVRDNGAMAEHHFQLTLHWPGGRNGVGSITCGQLQTQVSIDPQMDGPGVGTNPDEMFLSAAGSCYFMTLAAMIERAQLAVESLSLQSEMTVAGSNGGFVCEQMTHRPRITLAASASTADMRTLRRLVNAADRACMLSRAMRGNVAISLQPQLTQANE